MPEERGRTGAEGFGRPANGGPTDAEIMDRVRRGDVDAFELLVERYWTRTLMYSRNLGCDSERGSDIAQEAFARLWERRKDWVQAGSVRVWLFRTARHLIISDQRKRKVRREWAERLGKSHPSPSTPLQETEKAEIREAITHAVAQLSPRRREVFTLFHLHGFSYRDISKIMEIRQQTVANYLQAAMADLRASLAPRFPGLGASHDSRKDDR